MRATVTPTAVMAAVTLLAFGIASAASASQEGRLREKIAGRRAAQQPTADQAATGARRLAYGADKEQRILFWAAPPPLPTERRRPPPLAVYIHGGGWENGSPEMVSAKPAWFRDHRWAFASIGYRMLPDHPVEEQARDIGRALVKLRDEARLLGFDPDRILLTGHSAGAHLAALVSTDPQYAGTAFAAIKGTVPIDGACYDVPSQIAASPFMARRTYIPAFGTNPDRQLALSPVSHVGGADVGDWLLLYATARDDARRQSEMLEGALDRAGAIAEVVAVATGSNRSLAAHRKINVEFGTPGFAANPQVEAIMQRVER